MSKKYNIALLVISVLVLLITPFTPHHHHEGVACAVIERCDDDGIYNDEHTGHHESSDASHSKTSCVENAQYIVSKAGQNHKTSVDNLNPAFLISFLIPQYTSYLPSHLDSEGKLVYWNYIITYKSAEIIKSNGLRGPPSYIA